MTAIILSGWTASATVAVFLILFILVLVTFGLTLIAIRLIPKAKHYIDNIKSKGWTYILTTYFTIFIFSVILTIVLLTIVAYARGGKGLFE